jgi:UDP-N-acetylglucosamine--N-acetylmuramyl-(pentapeptide) pyrophosphoryl-undecaprenol N-acetylglucosamine transferase
MAGGTGGHVYPALAVAQALQRESRDIVWLGTHRGLESRVVPAAGINMEWISVRGLRRKGLTAMFIAPFQLCWALIQSLMVIARRRPAAVLGMGGFVSGPGGVAAWLTRRPLVIHEQNAAAGLTNRLLARLARVVLQAFPGSFNSRLNRTVPAALALLPSDIRPVVRHQCGETTIDKARDAYAGSDIDVDLVPFIEDMASAYAWADLVVCRAGALTVAELCAVGLPAVFVPYPSAVDDHQTANAKPMTEAGAATIIQESDLSDESLAAVLCNWLRSRDELRARAENARALAKPQALERITELCLQQAGAVS